ncbi:TfoX/Sxy family protein [Sphingomonas sp. ac-8]|uniref:TfoX/Sxy family protein n=1 Tax=Sphingomonas sp. ac-8 TaxID=3242977 RepID=UPI003A80B393
MAVDAGLIEWVGEAMAPIGHVTSRRMMGGATLYCDDTIFAIAGDDGLWFKADAQSDATWDAAGCARFTYAKGDGATGSMNYRRAPDDVYDDADAMREWGRLGLEAGRRAPPPKSKRARAGSKGGASSSS